MEVHEVITALSKEWDQWFWSESLSISGIPQQWVVSNGDQAEVVITFQRTTIVARGYDWRKPPTKEGRAEEEKLEIDLHDPNSFAKLKKFIQENIDERT